MEKNELRMNSMMSKAQKEPTLNDRKLFLEEKLRQSGEEARLENYLRTKLIESGWKDQLKIHCKHIIKEKGLERITIEELVQELTVKAKALVPLKLKEDLLSKIKVYFEDECLM